MTARWPCAGWREAAAKYSASLAASARLRAELEEADTVTFPAALDEESFDDLRANETALFRSRQANLTETLAGLTEGLELLEQELTITQRLQSSGAASRVELIRLQRDAAETRLEIARLKADHRVKTGEELQRINADAEVQGGQGVKERFRQVQVQKAGFSLLHRNR